MIDPDRAIVRPVKGKNCPDLPDLAVMVSTKRDLDWLASLFEDRKLEQKKLYNGILYHSDPFSFAGPMLGAPYAVMMLETLLSWGAGKVLFVGWCGSISAELKVGTVLVPTGAFIDEGTSRGYGGIYDDCARPSEVMTNILREALRFKNVPFQEGPIWTTDSIFRETVQKVEYFKDREAVAVEMELSALFTVSRYRQAELGAVLVVSDDLSDYTWKPGFKSQAFKDARKNVCEAIREICLQI